MEPPARGIGVVVNGVVDGIDRVIGLEIGAPGAEYKLAEVAAWLGLDPVLDKVPTWLGLDPMLEELPVWLELGPGLEEVVPPVGLEI